MGTFIFVTYNCHQKYSRLIIINKGNLLEKLQMTTAVIIKL